MASAYDDAVKLLARRALSRRGVAARLAARGHGEEAITQALERLQASGAIDDLGVARQLIAQRGSARGRERIAHELRDRGIDDETAAVAWLEVAADGLRDEGAALTSAVRRRLGAPPGRADRGRLARVYNALLSEGFEPARVASALVPYGFREDDE